MTHSSTRVPRPGDCIRVRGNSNGHNYKSGLIYRVVRVDSSDQTLVAVGPGGEEGNWIKWADIAYAAEIGWDWLQKALPTEAVELLSAFDGLTGLILREDVRSHILLRVPDLKEKILQAQIALESDGADAN
ncbi:MAG: hypothetical protein JJT96_10855 [Opitutales bacterium]|nr:hypothetical protein [Opitutales bacterium]